MIVLVGGTVYGCPNETKAPTQHVYAPQLKDVVISGGKILTMIEPSQTAGFIDSIVKSKLSILTIPVKNQIIIPGLIDVHVHAIGGGGEQGLSKLYFDDVFLKKKFILNSNNSDPFLYCS